MSPSQLSRFSLLASKRGRTLSASTGSVGDLWESSISLVRNFEADHQRGQAVPVTSVWANQGPDAPLSLLVALIKVELRARFNLGEKPAITEYLDRFPELRGQSDWVVSLVYEEYCLRGETGEWPDPESFCGRYASWRDSLLSQLQYHRDLSQMLPPPNRPQRFPEPGDWFTEGYRLGRLLGSGGAGRVFLAYQPECRRDVVLKVTPENAQDIEPSLLGRLNHDHIMPIWAVVRDQAMGLRGLCMPYRPGLPLDEIINRLDPKSRPPRRALSLLATVLPTATERDLKLPKGWQGFPIDGSYARGVAWLGATIARALAHAHDRQIYHRDVKPANILLTAREGPQLLDFNLAHAESAGEQAAEARSGGTLPYMAPEQLRAFVDPSRWPEVGQVADLFALGLVLRELLTGERPEAPDPSLSLPQAVQEMIDFRALPAPTLRSLNPEIPHGLDAIIDRCLAFEPSERYPDAASLADDLQRFVDYQAPRLVRNPSRLEATSHWLRRNRLKLAATSTLLLALTTAGFAWQGLHAHYEQESDRQQEAIRQVSQGRSYLNQKQWYLAQEAFGRARELDPELHTALHGLGSVAVFNEDFAKADRLLTEAIGAATRTTPTVSPPKLADLYLDRGRNRFLWGRSLLKLPGRPHEGSGAGDGQRESLRLESEGHLIRALADIDQARQWKQEALESHSLSNNPETIQSLVALENVAANIEVSLGDIASLRDDETRLTHYQNAWDHLMAARQIKPNDLDTLEATLAVLTAIQGMRPGDEAIQEELRAVRSQLLVLSPKAGSEAVLSSTSVLPLRIN